MPAAGPGNGWRAGEMLGLTWGAVHLDQRFVTLPETKNGEARDVPLSKRAVELIELMTEQTLRACSPYRAQAQTLCFVGRATGAAL